MNCIIYFWNRLYFGIFECHKQAQLFAFKTIEVPIGIIAKALGHRRNPLEKNKKVVLNALTDPQKSSISRLAMQSMYIFSCCSIFALVNFSSILFPHLSLVGCNEILFFVALGTPTFCINYFFLWRNDKYLVYYKLFEKSSRRTNRVWRWVSFLSVIGSIVLLIFSFIAMSSDN